MADRWKAAFGFQKRPDGALPAERNVHTQYSSDLQGLLQIIRVAGRRALTNDFVKRWLVWVSWISVAVILAAAVSRRLTSMVVVALIALGVGIAVALLQAWSKRASDYRVACKLDESAGLQDRLSTALFLGSPENTQPIVIPQRRDALRRLPGLDPKALFPIRMPSYAIQTLTLVLVAAALLAYRVHFKAPILALVQSAANSRVEKAVISPLVGVVKKDLMALVNREPEVQQAAADAETVPGLPDAKNGDDPVAVEQRRNDARWRLG